MGTLIRTLRPIDSAACSFPTPGTLALVSDAAAAALVAAGLAELLEREVSESAYTAQSVLAAATAGSPAPVTLAEGTILGRVAGGSVAALTQSEALAVVGAVDGYHHLATGDGSMLRSAVTSNTVPMSTTVLRLAYFRARKTESVTQVRAISGTTAAAATPSLCRLGVYSVDGSGNLALVGSTANDTSLFAGASTVYTRSLSAPFTKTAGSVYAFGILVVSDVTMPTVCGIVSALGAAEVGLAPRITGFVAGMSDLPATVAVGSVADSASIVYGVLLP